MENINKFFCQQCIRTEIVNESIKNWSKLLQYFLEINYILSLNLSDKDAGYQSMKIKYLFAFQG